MTAEHNHLPIEGEIRIGGLRLPLRQQHRGRGGRDRGHRWAAENLARPGRGRRSRLQVHVLQPGQELVTDDIKNLGPQPHRGRRLLTAPPREHVRTATARPA